MAGMTAIETIYADVDVSSFEVSSIPSSMFGPLMAYVRIVYERATKLVDESTHAFDISGSCG